MSNDKTEGKIHDEKQLKSSLSSAGQAPHARTTHTHKHTRASAALNRESRRERKLVVVCYFSGDSQVPLLSASISAGIQTGVAVARVSAGYTQIELGGQRKNVSRFFCDEKDSNISRRCFVRIPQRFPAETDTWEAVHSKLRGQRENIDGPVPPSRRKTQKFLNEWRSFCRL